MTVKKEIEREFSKAIQEIDEVLIAEEKERDNIRVIEEKFQFKESQRFSKILSSMKETSNVNKLKLDGLKKELELALVNKDNSKIAKILKLMQEI